MKKRVFPRAETLIEALVAISMLMIVLGPASASYISSQRALNTNKNDLIATALADEGIEMIQDFRDTNVLRFSSKSACWNTLPNITKLSTCDIKVNKIGDETSTMPFVFQLIEDLSDFTSTLGAAKPQNGKINMEDYRLWQDPSTSLYFIPPPGYNQPATVSPYYRQIIIQYLDVPLAGPYEAMRITSRVSYARPGGDRIINRELILSRPQ